jgi:hypothetical protein
MQKTHSSQLAIFRADHKIPGLLGAVLHAYTLLAEETRTTVTHEDGRIENFYHYLEIEAIHALSTQKNPDNTIRKVKLSEWFDGKHIHAGLQVDSESIIKGEFKLPPNRSIMQTETDPGQYILTLPGGAEIIKSVLTVPNGTSVSGPFKLSEDVFVQGEFTIDSSHTVTGTFFLVAPAKILRVLPIDPNYEVPQILGTPSFSSSLRFYMIKHPLSKDSPFHINSKFNQENLFKPETDNDRAHQFGGYWPPPYRPSRQQRLVPIYEGNDVLEVWHRVGHPLFLKLLNEQNIPYSYGGVGNVLCRPPCNSNSGYSFIEQVLQGDLPIYSPTIPPGLFSLAAWQRFGIYNPLMLDPVTFMAGLKAIAGLNKLVKPCEKYFRNASIQEGKALEEPSEQSNPEQTIRPRGSL